jgi:hypothetical protein
MILIKTNRPCLKVGRHSEEEREGGPSGGSKKEQGSPVRHGAKEGGAR